MFGGWTMDGDKYPCGTPRPGKADSASGASRSLKSTPRQQELLAGRQVEPIRLNGNENIADLVDHCYGGSGFNGRRLAEACQLYSRMLKAGATVGMTISGAMTPIGMQGVFIDLMQ